jgi:hypothetical protein
MDVTLAVGGSHVDETVRDLQGNPKKIALGGYGPV